LGGMGAGRSAPAAVTAGSSRSHCEIQSRLNHLNSGSSRIADSTARLGTNFGIGTPARPPFWHDLNGGSDIAIERTMTRLLEFTLNGRPRADAVGDNLLLLDYLREMVGLTGTKTGCDGGECGACTVLIDDQPRLSCLTLAASVRARRVDTVESLGRDGRLSAVQRGFHEKLGSQCGYCTPGFILASAGLLRRNPNPSETEISEALGSNICRCTGYVKIIEAVKYAVELHAAGETP
jgi:4-hydroxybenzoyl-CoA reductase subunit gamma